MPNLEIITSDNFHESVARDSDLDSHVENLSNPHEVTAAQLGAVETTTLTNLIGSANGICPLNSSSEIDPSYIPDGYMQDAIDEVLTVSLSGWKPILTSKYTATPISTSSIAMSDTSNILVGHPLRYTYNSVTYYGLVKSITTNTSITIYGAPLNTGYALTDLSIGEQHKLVYQPLLVINSFAAASSSHLLADAYTPMYWYLGNAYLVRVTGLCGSEDTGSTFPKCNVTIGGNAVLTTNTNAGLEITETLNSSEVDINVSNYDITNGALIDISTDAGGDADDSDTLNIYCIFVLE